MPHLPTMSWDYAEQLRHVNLQGGGDAYYVYDLDGQRIRKVIETNGTTVKERIYLGAWEIYRVRNASGIQLERESLHIMDEQNRIGLVETKTIGESNQEGLLPIARYQISDHLGSASMELDDVGEMISYEEYHPYGTTAYHAGSSLINVSQKRYRYTGKERDEESGFSYHEARYYSNVINRWLTPDPAGVSGGQNLYAYVLGNPINLIDEHGTAPTPPKLNSNQQQQVSQVMKGQINFAHIVVDQGKNAHLVVMNPSGVSVAHRTSKETYTQMGLRQDNSNAVDVTVTGIVLDELPWATDVGFVKPKIMDPKKGIKLGGFVVENGKQSGRTSDEGFSFSATNELSESSRMYQELGMPLPLQQSNTSLGWEFKQGNPNPKSIVGVGGLAPVIIGGIPYGKGNLYSGEAPPGGPRKGPPPATHAEFLTQRNSTPYDVMLDDDGQGLVIIGHDEQSGSVFVFVQEEDAVSNNISPGFLLDDVRDFLIAQGVDGAVLMDSGGASALVIDDKALVKPDTWRNNVIPQGIHFTID